MARDTTRDMTTGSPVRLILAFTIPMLLGNLFQQFYSMADTLIVGRTLGVDALSAVGATGSVSFLILGFAQGLTAGLSVITAQRFGAGDEQGVRVSFATSLLVSAAVAVLLTAGSMLGARQLLELMRTPAEIMDAAYAYIAIIFAGIAAAMFYNLFANILRALGDSRTPLLFLIAGSAFNITFDLICILVFRMGVRGAAAATVAAQVLTCVCCAAYIARRFPMLRLRRADFRGVGQALACHLQVGLPMGFQQSIIAIGTIIVQVALNMQGKLAVAAFTAASKIDTLTTPLTYLGVTMATYSAQNYGAGSYPRIKEGVRKCAYMELITSAVLMAVVLACGPDLVRLFVGSEPEVIALSRTYFNITCMGYPFLALLFLYRYTLQGLGKSFVPTFAGAMELVMRLAMTLALAGPLGFAGICLANPMAWVGSAVPLMIAYFITIRRLLRRTEEQHVQETF